MGKGAGRRTLFTGSPPTTPGMMLYQLLSWLSGQENAMDEGNHRLRGTGGYWQQGPPLSAPGAMLCLSLSWPSGQENAVDEGIVGWVWRWETTK